MKNAQMATRLSCFVIISTLESDLREECRKVADIARTTDLMPTDVRERAAKRWLEHRKLAGHQHSEDADTDVDLLDYTDFADLSKILHALSSNFQQLTNRDVAVLANRLAELS